MVKGSCLCGGVAFELDRPIRQAIACHCTQCRKTSGHFWAATNVPHSQFRLIKSATLTWFQSSATARRGFRTTCGASLFWKKSGENAISVAAGLLDDPTGIAIAKHIFVADKGDYYDID